MSNVTIVVGKKLIPLDQIVMVEPFDPAAHPGMKIKSDKPFKSRLILIDRQSVLTEETVEAFAAANGFLLLAEDQAIINPAIRFSVERFEPANGFEPNKPYKTRLSWRDETGEVQSKLLLSPPETVLAIAVTGETPAEAEPGDAPKASGGRKATASSMRPSSQRRRRRQPAAEATPT